MFRPIKYYLAPCGITFSVLRIDDSVFVNVVDPFGAIERYAFNIKALIEWRRENNAIWREMYSHTRITYVACHNYSRITQYV